MINNFYKKFQITFLMTRKLQKRQLDQKYSLKIFKTPFKLCMNFL